MLPAQFFPPYHNKSEFRDYKFVDLPPWFTTPAETILQERVG